MISMLYAQVQQHANRALACRALGVSRSGYADWSRRTRPRDLLRPAVRRIARTHSSYGYRRVTHELRRNGVIANHKRVLKIMKTEQLLCRRKRFKPQTTSSNHGLRVYPNLARYRDVTGPNQLWVADITYVRLLREFVYLAVVIDVFSRRVVGWALSREIDTELALAALRRAFACR